MVHCRLPKNTRVTRTYCYYFILRVLSILESYNSNAMYLIFLRGMTTTRRMDVRVRAELMSEV